jgi:hypothetical protein
MIDSASQDTAAQMAALGHNPARPLILCDADEVLLTFLAAFENFLHGRGLYYAWRSYALDGNILECGSKIALAMAKVRALIEEFYADHADTLKPVSGAPEALKRLSARADIVILTNIWQKYRLARQTQLASYGLPFPVVSNSGSKGPSVAWFAERSDAPLYFIDDSARHHSSVARHAAAAVRIHFVAERRLAGLVGPAEDCNYRVDSWASAQHVIERNLTAKGF